MTKYKYYFRQPTSEITKDILKWLIMAGLVCIAATSPYFIRNLMRAFKNTKKYGTKKIYDTFYVLQKQGDIRIAKKNKQIYISLTEKGRRKAGWMQIDKLKIKKPKKWDRKWRIVIFDISHLKNLYRDAFRGKLKELGFCPLQKSVWVHPFNCKDEVALLRNFFGLTEKEVRLIVADNIEKDGELRRVFGIH